MLEWIWPERAIRAKIQRWLLKPGHSTSLRFYFAFFGLDERYGDITTVAN
jgi:hypothetical protein